ncbi:hypothetical protein GPX89_01660 [Nocardia sp. ET3-3]|uniref:Uncharacterized protein n=1 Tax=Nocardia terrae TaxID=2675851 RepID=A0A7K1UNP8_9NOCA|nr:hypothetical protein [Nocardia terrae]MVU75947.1 hypothetical protein [Nocardia terrae]
MTNQPGWPNQEPYPGPPGYPVYPNPNEYQPFGAGGPTPGKGTPPQTVTYAFYLMLAGAALSIIGMLVGFTQINETRQRAAEASHGNLSDHDIDTLVNVGLGVGVVVSLISAGLWIWMAFASRAGKNWARVTGTVFFGLYTLSMLAEAFTANATAVTIAFSVLTWLVGLATVILLWIKQSGGYFRPAPVYTPYPPIYPGGPGNF